MSGIYMVVWDQKNQDKSTVLKPTKGGWPHVTLFYSGSSVPKQKLMNLIAELYSGTGQPLLPTSGGPLRLPEEITLTSAYVNTFTPEGTQTPRHDVLMKMDSDSQEKLTALRAYLQQALPEHNLSMGPLHVTHGIFSTAREAKQAAKLLNRTHLPHTVSVIGTTYD